MATAHVDVELLVVPDCPNSAAARELLHTTLAGVGLAGTAIRVSVIDSQAEAERRHFVGSPTILLGGVDPFGEPGRAPALACRLYTGSAGPSGVPEAEQLRAALSAALSDQVDKPPPVSPN